MSTVSRYVVSATPEDWNDGDECDSYEEAKGIAAERGACVTEITYTFEDSELVDDFRPTPDEEDDPVDLIDGEELDRLNPPDDD